MDIYIHRLFTMLGNVNNDNDCPNTLEKCIVH